MKKGSIAGIPFQINPAQVKYQRKANWVDMNVAFIEVPSRQFTGGSGVEIQCEVVFDFSQGDVESAVTALDKKVKKQSKTQAPEIVSFEFGNDSYKGAIVEFIVSKTLFTTELKCIRARAQITFVEMGEEGGKTRLDEKGIRSYIIEEGDNYFSIAHQTEIFGKEMLWKAIADYNPDPYQKSIFLTKGTEIKIPPGDIILEDYEQETIEGQVPWA
jgi:hypothetical protein